MHVTVVDCSAIAAVAFVEPDGEAIISELKGRQLMAPALLPFELSQVCTMKCRLHPAMSDRIIGQYLSALSSLAIQFAPVDFEAIPPLAQRTGLSAYDGAYLWLALAHRAPLVSLDTNLVRAYRKYSEQP